MIRGITGYTMLDGKRLKVYASKVIKDGAWQEAAPGTIVDPKALAADFLRGKQLAAGTVLG